MGGANRGVGAASLGVGLEALELLGSASAALAFSRFLALSAILLLRFASAVTSARWSGVRSQHLSQMDGFSSRLEVVRFLQTMQNLFHVRFWSSVEAAVAFVSACLVVAVALGMLLALDLEALLAWAALAGGAAALAAASMEGGVFVAVE